jgi:hypothetical protein
MIIDMPDGFEPVVFRAVRPDGHTVTADVVAAISTTALHDGTDDWHFFLTIANGLPRGGSTRWTISHVRAPTSG